MRIIKTARTEKEINNAALLSVATDGRRVKVEKFNGVTRYKLATVPNQPTDSEYGRAFAQGDPTFEALVSKVTSKKRRTSRKKTK